MSSVLVFVLIILFWSPFLIQIFYALRERRLWPTGDEVSTMDGFVQYLRGHTHDMSMVLTSMPDGSPLVEVNARVPRVLASTVKIIILIAYARQVEAGVIDPGEKVPLSDLSRWYIHGTDGGAHRSALKHMTQAGRIRDARWVTLHEVVQMMIRFSSNAAADYLLNLLGLGDVNNVQDELLAFEHTPILFFGGSVLLMTHALRGFKGPAQANVYLETLSEADKLEMSTRLICRFEQHAWRRMCWRLSLWFMGLGGGLKAQALLVPNVFPRSCAEDYTRLMSRVMSGTLDSERTSAIVREHLQWLTDQRPRVAQSFSRIGMKGGSLPGVLTAAVYAQVGEGEQWYVLSLFVNGIPTGVYASVTKNKLFIGFVFRLLNRPRFRQDVAGGDVS